MRRLLSPLLAILWAVLGLAACDQLPAVPGVTAADEPLKVTVVASGRTLDGIAPRFQLLADGKPAGERLVAADHAHGQADRYTFFLSGGRPRTVTVRYLNDADGRDLWVDKVTLGTTSLDPKSAVYLPRRRAPIAGQGRMPWAGDLVFQL